MLAIGIDLGTTFSVVATINSFGRPEVVRIPPDNSSTTPSVVYFPESGSPVVGSEAKAMQALGEQNVASFFKREMGDPGFSQVYRGKTYSATDLSALVLKHLKEGAEEVLGETIEAAVITVPAYFNDKQRNATINAAEQAGFKKVLRIINEPTAAAIAFGLAKGFGGEKTMMVYDLGGGTFDVSIVKIANDKITVLATDGDHRLGGKNWDDRIATNLAQRFRDEFGTDPFEDMESFNDLLVRCENAKKDLSLRESTRVSIVHNGERGMYVLTRPEFEKATFDLLDRTRIISESVLSAVPGLNWSNLDGVVLVGGSTRMPMVIDFVREMTGQEPLHGINVDEAVALGAALQAASDLKQDSDFQLEGVGETFSLPTIVDVTSHSLGMIAENEDRSKYINSFIIQKNTSIPCTRTKAHMLRTSSIKDNELEVYMLQGEMEQPLECTILGKYVFSGISHVPNQKVVIDVSYTYNKNGTVDVSAVQRETNQPLKLRICPIPEDMTWLERSPAENDPPAPPTSIVIAIDVSGSMLWGEPVPIDEARKAAKALVERLDLNRFQVGILAFSDRCGEIIPCNNSKRRIFSALDSGVNGLHLGGGNEAIPFQDAYHMFSDNEGASFIVLLTDGVWEYPGQAIHEAKQIHKRGVKVIAIGFGDADYDFLREIATCDEDALMTDVSGLVESFSKIGQVLSESSMSAGSSSSKSIRGFFPRK